MQRGRRLRGMLSINDKFAPDVAKDVYVRLLRDGTSPNQARPSDSFNSETCHLRTCFLSLVWVSKRNQYTTCLVLQEVVQSHVFTSGC